MAAGSVVEGAEAAGEVDATARPMRVVAYIRVSSQDQVHGHPLDAQARLFYELCINRGWEPGIGKTRTAFSMLQSPEPTATVTVEVSQACR